MNTLLTIVEELAQRAPLSNPLRAPGRLPLSATGLQQHVIRNASRLQQLGLRADDIVAVVFPNGPEMATAFLSVAVSCICAPLNPAYREDEFEFYLTDLPAKALMIGGFPESPAREVARRLGIQVIEITWSETAPAGIFDIQMEGQDSRSSADYETSTNRAALDEATTALVLHTSGTTSRPKIVPLTHANLFASAGNVAKTLDLSSDDVCLNVMPLFHIHGLVAALLASLRAGGSVICGPGFIAPKFFDWVTECQPTWYTAVPTMHASILSRAASHPAKIESHRLRFIRSSSAALPRNTYTQLEKLFRVPVIEAYGMTEAAHQMASNPLPPDPRKPGTVGRAAGPEIAILDANGNAVSHGTRGEIAISGANVTQGYVRNPSANAAAFINGWLRTGDEGAFDDDGYLTIHGRIKEVINRGGEKISPLEIEEVILDHPAVAQAVTFAAADAVLGEEVVSAVVLHPGAELSERRLREFVAARLAHFKVPRRILFMESIPLGPTGKMQRIGLAERLGIVFDLKKSVPAQYVAPSTPVEEIVSSIWSSVMAVDSPGVDDNFFDAGGDSILAAQLISRVRQMLAVEVSLIAFFDSPTIAGLATVIDEAMMAESGSGSPGQVSDR